MFQCIEGGKVESLTVSKDWKFENFNLLIG